MKRDDAVPKLATLQFNHRMLISNPRRANLWPTRRIKG